MEIGRQNIESAHRYKKLVMICGIIQSLAIGSFLYFGRHIIADFYTNIDDLREETARVL